MPAVKRASKKHSRRASKDKTSGQTKGKRMSRRSSKMSKIGSKKKYKLSGGSRNSVSRKKSKKTVKRRQKGGNTLIVPSHKIPISKPPSDKLYPIAENNTASDLHKHKTHQILKNSAAVVESANIAIQKANQVEPQYKPIPAPRPPTVNRGTKPQ